MAIPTNADFENGPLADHGVTVSRTPVTKTNDNLTGDRILTDGSPANISIVFENPNIVQDVIIAGEEENSEVKAYVKGDVTINEEDKITWNSAVFRVEAVSTRYFGANLIFKRLTMTLITP